mmetsp:Transcript_20732/g.26961  ORF Transcript_20732/g.26961 Transcript_20732/m.26961 type:complete len:1149 (+) Transcript_20732:2219-5665(+)
MSKVWNMGVPDELFINLFCRTAYQLLEQPINGRGSNEFRNIVLELIAIPLKLLKSIETTVVATILDLLHNSEHCVTNMVHLCKVSSVISGNFGLAKAVLREVVHIDLSTASARSGAGVKNIATFISELSDVLPSVVLQNMSVLKPFLDSEPHILRSCITSVIANVVTHATLEQRKANTQDCVTETNHDNEEESEGEKEMGSCVHSKDSFVQTRDTLLDILTERAHDVSSYTRAAVLKAWVVLCENGALPLLRVQKAVLLAVDRLKDKAQLVRKAALQLLTTLLECNPFMGSLDPSLYEDRAAQVELWLQENPLPEDLLEDKKKKTKNNKDDIQEKENEDDDEDDDESEDDEKDDDVEEKEESPETMELRSIRATKVREYELFMSACDFIQVLDKEAGPMLEVMLRSKNSSDVIETLRFFVQASHYQLPCASHGLRSSWSLAWSTDMAILDEVCKSFLLVHVYEPGTLDINHHQNKSNKKNQLSVGKVAMNLIHVVQSASNAERTCLEELFSKLVQEDQIDKGVFVALRKAVEDDKKQLSIRSCALLVLSMAAVKQPLVLGKDEKQLKVLVEAGLGSHMKGSVDWELVRCACLAIKNASNENIVKKSEASWETQALGYCACILRADWFDSSQDDTKQWFAAAEQALSCVFALSASPEVLCAEIIKSHYNNVLGPNAEPCTASRLACFCHLIGSVALCLLVYTERVALILKKTISSQSKSKKTNHKGSGKDNEEEDNEDKDSLVAELGLNAEADLEHDQRVAYLIDNDIIKNNLLSVYEPLLIRIVANEHGLFSAMVLREAACLSLCKYMCISVEACDKNLPLLFTTLANEKYPSVRGNIIVALGDLAFRFPNSVEPWTSHIYKRLKDESENVRSQTLMVLSHLILNDMIKVKGQVATMVLCLEDSSKKTSDLARMFFQELGKRGNSPIYNLMPDIVSLLSQDDNVSQETFRNVIPFLMSFITKDKHSESLAEKLCFRFDVCLNLKQIQDVAFCLSQLPINEKALKKLDSLIKLYRNHLFDKDVYSSFMLLINKSKKFIKPEMKEALLEYADKIKSIHQGGDGTTSQVKKSNNNDDNEEKEEENNENNEETSNNVQEEESSESSKALSDKSKKSSQTKSSKVVSKSNKSLKVGKENDNAAAPSRQSRTLR